MVTDTVVISGVFTAWWLSRKFPDGSLYLRAGHWEKTWNWGSYAVEAARKKEEAERER